MPQAKRGRSHDKESTMIEILNRYTQAVIYRSETASTIGEAVREALDMDSKANLQYANLQGANLQYANLQYANLQDAKLQDANLQDAKLQYANLQYANLQYANLQYANLQGAKLQYANLIQMRLDYWTVTVSPTHTCIGCQRHENAKWLAHTPESVSDMNEHASAFWIRYGDLIKSAIKICMGEKTTESTAD